MSNKMKDNKQQENNRSAFDLTDEFKCAELLLDADEDRDAFEIFLRLATEDKKKRNDAIDKLLYIALKNSHKSNLLDNDTWGEIETLSEKGIGYEFAYLLLHFKYYSKGDHDDAYKSLKNYFENKYYSLRKDKADFKVIMEFFRNNTEGISPIAYLQYGVCLEWGLGIPVDEISANKAMLYYRIALDRGCVAAYICIVGLYLFGSVEFDKNIKKAKNEFSKGIKDFKDRLGRNEKDIKPLFKMLVGACFKGDWVKEMDDEGKELAQYMIENGIKGGFDLMGKSFLSGDNFNLTMAKNYFEEALKNDEASAYGDLAIINLTEENQEEAFKLARKGYSENDSFSFSMLGMMYEMQGDKENNKERQKRCYDKAWYIYYKAYTKFGNASDDLGRLCLDKEILPVGYEDEIKRILEISAIQLRSESIKYYLRLIQKINGKDFTRIDPEIVFELPYKYRKKYLKYLKVWVADTNDIDISNEIIDFAYKYTDKKTKAKLSRKLVDGFYVASSKKQFASIIENYNGKQGDDFVVWSINTLFTLFYNENKDEYNRFLKEIKNAFVKSKDEDIKKSVEAFVQEILLMEHIDEDDGIRIVKDAIEKTGDEDIKESLRTILFGILVKKYIVENEGIEVASPSIPRHFILGLLHSEYKESEKDIENSSEKKQEPAIVKFLSAIENSKDKGLKKIIERFNDKLLDFFHSCFIETPNESSDSHAENNGK